MFYQNIIWWFILLIGFIGYFTFRFGIISRGSKKDLIEFIGGTILAISFVAMFFLGWRIGLLYILIFWFVITPINEIIISKIKKRLI